MKHLKLIGLAAVAAGALTAFSASSASADVYCTENRDPCPKGKTIALGVWSEVAGSASMRDTSGNELSTCTVSTIETKVEKQGEGINPQGPITSLTWGAKGAGCNTTVDTVKNGRFEVREEGGERFLWAKETEVTLVAFGVSCTYGAGTGTKMDTIDAGTDPLLTEDVIFLKTAGSFLCPSTSKWTGTYTLTNHTQLWIVKKGED